MNLVAPSLLAADFLNLENEINKINNTKADWLHLDIMDGNFVNNITFGPDLVKQLRKHTNLLFDVHLMLMEPNRYFKDFVKAGAEMITFHYESYQNNEQRFQAIELIKSLKCQVGIAINPKTSVKVLEPFYLEVNMFLIMSVEPGFGGQKFMPKMLEKIETLVKVQSKYNYLIQMDGGINNKNIQLIKNSGVNVIVAGSYLFNGNMSEKINEIKE